MSGYQRRMPLLALSVAVALVIAGVVMAVYIDRFNTRQQIDENTVQARILASTVTAALWFGDQAAAQEYVNAMRTNPEILIAAIYDQAGKLFVSDARMPDHAAPAESQTAGAK